MQSNWRTPLIVILAGALIVNFSMGIRHGMGLFLTPMTSDLHMSREAIFAPIFLSPCRKSVLMSRPWRLA